MVGKAKTPASTTAIPSVDRLMRAPELEALAGVHGRPLVIGAVRSALDTARKSIFDQGADTRTAPDTDAIIRCVEREIASATQSSLRPMFNLTGTVLHTNLGRSVLPEEAIAAVAAVAGSASNLEFDVEKGRRGDRDAHVEALICRLTGAEAATVVNNNAAAVLLVLNTLALRKEVPVSRGELIEIGGAFRMPDIMARAGCRLHEVGTTNRTHLKDFEQAIGPRTGLLMTVHTSNYEVQGFTAAVPEAELAALAHSRSVPFVVDLGSGTLVDLQQYGLPHEPTPADSIANGVDVVTFSGDKLLGGPQAGLIVGRKDLIAKIRSNPLKRALRLDKMTIAALSAVLRLYLDPARLAARLPTLRALTRPTAEIDAMARRLQPRLTSMLDGVAAVTVEPCQSQIGSGALPVDLLPSAALVMRPDAGKRSAGGVLKRLAAAFRALPAPVIGRIHDDALIFDLRCLEDEAAFLAQFETFSVPRGQTR